MSAEENSSNELVNLICKNIKENDEFLRKNAKDVYEEVIGLANDSIDLSSIILKKFKTGEEAAKHPMAFFALHIFMPMSYGIYVNLLIGNLPACFMQLRVLHETLAEQYSLETSRVRKNERIKIGKLMEELGDDFVKLWGKLSEEWVHPRGILKHIIENVIKKGMPPSWSIILPATYTDDDLNNLEELKKRIAQFRAILKNVISELYSST